MKEQADQSENAKGKLIDHIKKYSDIYSTLIVIGFHLIILTILFYFYFVIALNMYMKYIPMILFEVGFFLIVASEKHRYIRGIIFALVSIGLTMAIASPFSLYVYILSVTPLLIAGGIFLAGLGVGFFVKNVIAISAKKLFWYGAILVFVFNAFATGLTIINLESCEPYEDKDFCYIQKAERFGDENICANVRDFSDKRFCYIGVLFDPKEHEISKARSTTQCDDIINEEDRGYCYAYVAGKTLDESICDSLKGDEVVCYCREEVEKNKCYKLSGGEKRDCLDEVSRTNKKVEMAIKKIDLKKGQIFIKSDTTPGCAFWDHEVGALGLKTGASLGGTKDNVVVEAEVNVPEEADIMKVRYQFTDNESDTESVLEVFFGQELVFNDTNYRFSSFVIEQNAKSEWEETWQISEVEYHAGKKINLLFRLSKTKDDGNKEGSVFIKDVVFYKFVREDSVEDLEQLNRQNEELKREEKDAQTEYQAIFQEEVNSGDTTHARSKRFSDVSQIKSVAVNMAEQAKQCDEKGGVIKSTEGGMGFVCPSYDPLSWSLPHACGGQRDIEWVVMYKNDEWDFTLECKNYPECSGIENIKCTKEGCVFSESCK